MAHQAHNIPWTVLSSHLKPVFPSKPHVPANFYLRFQPQQAKQLNYFLAKFAANIESHTTTERAKLADEYLPPAHPDELLISDEAARRITPVLLQLRQHMWRHSPLFGETYCPSPQVASGAVLCQHNGNGDGDVDAGVEEKDGDDDGDDDGYSRRRDDVNRREFGCGCVLPLRHRKAAFFTVKVRHESRWPDDETALLEQWKVGIVKALLLCGEMDAVLRACAADQGPDLADWKETWYRAMDDEVGWGSVFSLALDAYLTLNIAHLFPSTWDPASGRTPAHDYRNTQLYQGTVYDVTSKTCGTDIAGLPHRHFFGIAAHESLWSPDWPREVFSRTGLPTATVPFPVFMGVKSRYMALDDQEQHEKVENAKNNKDKEKQRILAPGLEVINIVGRMFYKKGLPLELIRMVLVYADLEPRGRLLSMPTNPLHKDNRVELSKYLGYCWQLFVRCNVMAKALGMDIDWHYEIMTILTKRLGTAGRRRWWKHEYDEETGQASYVIL